MFAKTFVDVLRSRCTDKRGFTFLGPNGEEKASLPFAQLETRARALAVMIGRAVAPGDRALLLYAPGLEFITAFFGCLYAGAIAVPCYPPRPGKLERSLPRLRGIISSARPAVLLTSSEIHRRLQPVILSSPRLWRMKTIRSDEVSLALASEWTNTGVKADDIAFLQYTSGSTSTPKGVIVTHGNLIANSEAIRTIGALDESSVCVSWLPMYHDMGLVGAVLQPVYSGFSCSILSPTSVIKRPRVWLEAITRVRGTITASPNFALELCLRKVPAEQRKGLDLSSWEGAWNGAEPIRAATLERFAEAFGPVGFRRTSHFPVYGLAEATLLATGGDAMSEAVVRKVSRLRLDQGKAVEATESRDEVALVGCGRVIPGHQLAIVDPANLQAKSEGEVGEIWLAGPSMAQGYWGMPEESECTFRARIVGREDGPWMRTGDLGFQRNGELFVTGRMKDLIIVRGRNIYPQDIELAVESAHPAIRHGCSAAFSVSVDGEERLVIVAEVERRATAGACRPRLGESGFVWKRQRDPELALRAIREVIAEQFDLRVDAVALIQLGTIPKTTSGKIRRFACRQAFLEKKLEVVATSDGSEPKTLAAPTDPLVREICDLAASLIEIPPEAIAPHSALALQGLDSLGAVELEVAIEKRFGFSVPLEALVCDASPDTLARMLRDSGCDRPINRPATGPTNGLGGHVPPTRKEIELSSLFEMRRLASPVPAWILAYAPIGVTLAALRILGLAAWFTLALAMGKRRGARFLGLGAWLMGIKVRVRGRENLAKGGHVVVANHVFTLEGLAWQSLRPSVMVLKRAVLTSLPYALGSRLVPLIVSDAPGAARNITLAANDGSRPLFVFPEGATSNGKGLFRFEPFAFAIGVDVQPVAIRIRRRLPIRVSLLRAAYTRDLLWNLFCPSTEIEFTVLPAQQRMVGEHPAEFAERVRQMTARELGVPATPYTARDKAMVREGRVRISDSRERGKLTRLATQLDRITGE
jgi:acyl-CoA synthetase (AMP-forming)/AMP-acid ligase II/acyl carrier protein